MNEVTERKFVDVLDAEFVDAYIDAFKPPHRITYWGANKCRQLGADLAAMAARGFLKRDRVSLGSGWYPGFPRWVWCYRRGNNADLLKADRRDEWHGT